MLVDETQRRDDRGVRRPDQPAAVSKAADRDRHIERDER